MLTVESSWVFRRQEGKMPDSFSLKCSLCDTMLTAANENELADKYTRHMMAFHQKMVTHNEALKKWREQDTEVGAERS